MRILLRAGKAPHDAVGPEASFARNRSGVFGANVGNLLFTNAVYQVLNTPENDIVVDSLETESPRVNAAYADRINNEFDAFVLPLANAFRGSFIPWLDRLTAVITKLRIPVIVVGVGAQLNFSGDYSGVSEKTNTSVRRFMDAVLARSTSVGVRGELTANYLTSLGYSGDQVKVIGCPSMYVMGRHLSVDRNEVPLDQNSHLAMNVTPTISGIGKALEKVSSAYPNTIYVPQEHRELALLLWGKPVSGTLDPGVPGDTSHPLYQNDKIRFFLDPITWRRTLAERDFVLGNRIHGTIAAITAGTPAMLISHDSRTLELARYHALPYRPVPENPETIDPRKLHEEADFTALNRAAPQNFDRYTEFLEANGLEHIHQDGKDNPDYTQKLESTVFPRPVGTLYSDDREAVIGRLRWLWQSIDEDQGRRADAYIPPFKPTSAAHRSRVEELEETVTALARRVTQYEGVIDHLRQPAEKRVAQGIKTRLNGLRRRH